MLHKILIPNKVTLEIVAAGRAPAVNTIARPIDSKQQSTDFSCYDPCLGACRAEGVDIIIKGPLGKLRLNKLNLPLYYFSKGKASVADAARAELRKLKAKVDKGSSIHIPSNTILYTFKGGGEQAAAPAAEGEGSQRQKGQARPQDKKGEEAFPVHRPCKNFTSDLERIKKGILGVEFG